MRTEEGVRADASFARPNTPVAGSPESGPDVPKCSGQLSGALDTT